MNRDTRQSLHRQTLLFRIVPHTQPAFQLYKTAQNFFADLFATFETSICIAPRDYTASAEISITAFRTSATILDTPYRFVNGLHRFPSMAENQHEEHELPLVSGCEDIGIGHQQDNSMIAKSYTDGPANSQALGPVSLGPDVQQAMPTMEAWKESPGIEPNNHPAELSGERQAAEVGQVEVAEPDPQASTSHILLEPSVYRPTITLDQAPASTNKDFRRFTRYAGGVRSETGELRSGLTLPITKKSLKRAMDREHRRAEMPTTPALCRKPEEEGSVSSLELDGTDSVVSKEATPIVDFISKDWATKGEWVVHYREEEVRKESEVAFRSKDFARGGLWEIHYESDGDIFADRESKDRRPEDSSTEGLREYAERKAKLVLEKCC